MIGCPVLENSEGVKLRIGEVSPKKYGKGSGVRYKAKPIIVMRLGSRVSLKRLLAWPGS